MIYFRNKPTKIVPSTVTMTIGAMNAATEQPVRNEDTRVFFKSASCWSVRKSEELDIIELVVKKKKKYPKHNYFGYTGKAYAAVAVVFAANESKNDFIMVKTT